MSKELVEKFNNDFLLTVDGLNIASTNEGLASAVTVYSTIIPSGSTYSFTSTYGLITWFELRQ